MNKYDIFISYRREGGEHLGKMLRDSLVEKGYRVFFDVDSLVSGEFNTALYEVIEGCKDFILICTPNALDRCNNEGDWVYQEIDRAMTLGKNIIPIMARSFSFPDILPPSIDGIRWQNGLEANMEFYDAFIERLQTFMKSKPVASVKLKKPLTIALIAALFISLGVIAFFVINNNHKKDNVVPIAPPASIEADTNSTNEIDLQELQDEVVKYASSNISVVDLHYNTFIDCLAILDLYLSEEISSGKAKNNISITKGKLDYTDISVTPLNSELVKQLSDANISQNDIAAYASKCESSCTEYTDLIDAMISIIENPDYNTISIQKIRDAIEIFGELEKDTACEYFNLALIEFRSLSENEKNPGKTTILSEYIWETDESILKATISEKMEKKQEILESISY